MTSRVPLAKAGTIQDNKIYLKTVCPRKKDTEFFPSWGRKVYHVRVLDDIETNEYAWFEIIEIIPERKQLFTKEGGEMYLDYQENNQESFSKEKQT